MSTVSEYDASLKKLTKEFRRVTDKLLPSEVVLVQKKVVLELLSRLVLRTPVDTGRARGGWQASVGSPATEETGVLAPGAEAPIEGGVSEALSAAGAVISNALSAMSDLPPYSVVWITNNVPYIQALEDGHSMQAPPGGIILVSINDILEIFK